MTNKQYVQRIVAGIVFILGAHTLIGLGWLQMVLLGFWAVIVLVVAGL